MKMVAIPGYKDLFGDQIISYNEYVKTIPSDVIITILIMLNNELNATLPELENQKRLLKLISRQYSQDQLKKLNSVFFNYKQKKNSHFEGYIFGRRYLLSFILKELNNYRQFEIDDTTADDEFKFLMAYFLVIDEVNGKDNHLYEEALKKSSEPLGNYRMLWTPNINQYDFNDRSDPAFQFYKLLCFVDYLSNTYHDKAKEFVNKLGFKTFGQLLGSLHLVTMTTLDYKQDNVFKKLHFITTPEGIDNSHLKAQSIKELIGSKELSLNDIKKYPLFFNHRNEYMVIDEDIYNKKIYKGPFFELYYSTTLKDTLKFNQYSAEVSLKVLEQSCFKGILSSLQYSKHDVLHFDDDSDSSPDCYYRHNKDVFLLEFKGYLFPEDLSSNPEFDKIKEYIDSRFIKNEKGKSKGITQLLNQINLLYKNELKFDKRYSEELYKKRITIYPIVCHNDFVFSMPGINEYLNDIFENQIDSHIKEHFIIKPVTLIDLQILNDFLRGGGNFKLLGFFVDRYNKIIESRKLLAIKKLEVDTFLKSKSSFDEIYNSIFSSEIKKQQKSKDVTKRLFDLAGIKLEVLDKEL